jgi:tetratricopeptide (TPR) repeat protein
VTLSAAELHRRGRAHLNAGRNAAARRVLLLAAERTDDADLRARIAGSLASLTIRQGDPDAAELLCQEALALPGVSRATAAIIYGQLGLLALERGDLDEAVTLLDRGISGIGDDAEYRAPMLVNRSVAHSQAGHLAAARADVEAAARDYQTVGGEVERAMAVHNAGYIALLEGDLIAALETMGEARGALAAASAVNAAICDLDRAEVLRDAGLAREAERSLERVVSVFSAHRMRQAKGEAQFHLARSLITHAPAKAVVAAAAATRTFRGIGSEWWALRADAVRLRALFESASAPEADRSAPPAATLGDVDAVSDALETRRLRADAAALRLTRELWLAEHRGRPAEPVVIRTPRDAPIQVRLLAHEVRSARAATKGREADARRQAAKGLDALAEWQRSFGSLDLATSLVMHGRGLIFAGLRSAVRSRRPEVVFDWSERARHLSQEAVPVRPPRDEALAADLAELRMLRSESGGDWLSTPRAMELSERVRRRQWSSTGAAVGGDRITLEELRATLADDTALVSYVFDGTTLMAVAVVADDARVIEIAPWDRIRSAYAGLRADLDVSAAVRSGPMARVVQESLEQRLSALSAALVDPVIATIGDRRTAITVPGILGGIPWGMLPAMRRRAFTVATSASQWVADRGRATAPGVGFVAGPRVSRGMEEVSRAATAWDAATVLNPGTATVDATSQLASRVGTLHIAAHGRHAAENPLFSGLELTDGALFGYDIDLIPKVPDTVVLSACEVGRSSVRWGDEAVGMTRIWLHAGTRCVIAAPVVVADDVACELLGAMHERLAAGDAPAEALAAASAHLGVVAPFQSHGAGF